MKSTFNAVHRTFCSRRRHTLSGDWLWASAVLMLLLSATTALTAPKSARFDSYGGLRALKAEPSGWFRLGRVGDRDLLVTPEGHGYIALGVNHIGALASGGATSLFSTTYNRDWDRYFSEVLKPQLDEWNMNNVGYGAPAHLHDRMPFFAAMTLAPIEKHRSHPIPADPGPTNSQTCLIPTGNATSRAASGKRATGSETTAF